MVHHRRGLNGRIKVLHNKGRRLYDEMQPTITKMIEKLIRFDTGLSKEDLQQQAYLAINEAVLKYRRKPTTESDSEESKPMKISTFAFWYLQKHFYRTINADAVIYDVYDEDGNQIGSYYGKEYYQKKYSMPEHTVKTRRADIDLATIFNNNEEGGTHEDWTERISSEVLK